MYGGSLKAGLFLQRKKRWDAIWSSLEPFRPIWTNLDPLEQEAGDSERLCQQTKNPAQFGHFLFEKCTKLFQAPRSIESGYGMTKNGQTIMFMAQNVI